jgi:hypothetical protein
MRVSVTPWPLSNSGKDLVPIVQETGWAPGPVWTGAENLALTGIRSPDRPASSQSLYRLGYPEHEISHTVFYTCRLLTFFLIVNLRVQSEYTDTVELHLSKR